VPPGERRVGRQQNFPAIAEQLHVEELEKTSMAQDRPSQRRGDESDNCRPLARL
jgi:hypothetical protein